MDERHKMLYIKIIKCFGQHTKCIQCYLQYVFSSKKVLTALDFLIEYFAKKHPSIKILAQPYSFFCYIVGYMEMCSNNFWGRQVCLSQYFSCEVCLEAWTSRAQPQLSSSYPNCPMCTIHPVSFSAHHKYNVTQNN